MKFYNCFYLKKLKEKNRLLRDKVIIENAERRIIK